MDGSSNNRDENVLERVRSARGFVFDLDGTLTESGNPGKPLSVCPGAPELLALLGERNIPYVVLTNGTSRLPESFERHLTAVGLPISAGHIMTPASVAADVFRSRGMRRIMVLGVESVWRPLQEAGLEILLPSEGPIDPDTPVDAVFAGWYREFSLDDIEAACYAVQNGASLFAASLVSSFGSGDRRIIGSSRAICDMIESVTGVTAEAMGKPSPVALEFAARRLDKEPSAIAVIGDDPDLEIRMARAGGATAIAVESASYRQKQKAALDTPQPDASVRNLKELLQLLR